MSERSYEVLWANPNPHTSFSAQTITINDARYYNDGVLIDIYYSGYIDPEASNEYGHCLSTWNMSNLEPHALFSSRIGFRTTCIRKVEVSVNTSQNKTYFQFYDSYLNNDCYAQGEVNNSKCIPIEIRMYP